MVTKACTHSHGHVVSSAVQVAEGLRRFGVNEATKHVLVATFNTNPDQVTLQSTATPRSRLLLHNCQHAKSSPGPCQPIVCSWASLQQQQLVRHVHAGKYTSSGHGSSSLSSEMCPLLCFAQEQQLDALVQGTPVPLDQLHTLTDKALVRKVGRNTGRGQGG